MSLPPSFKLTPAWTLPHQHNGSNAQRRIVNSTQSPRSEQTAWEARGPRLEQPKAAGDPQDLRSSRSVLLSRRDAI